MMSVLFRSQDMGKERDDQKRTLAAWRAGVADKTPGTVNHRGVQSPSQFGDTCLFDARQLNFICCIFVF